MIEVRVRGRLGNQMFQYAAAKQLQYEYSKIGKNEDINFIFKYEKNVLSIFDIKLNEVQKSSASLKQRIIILFFVIVRALICRDDIPKIVKMETRFCNFFHKNGVYFNVEDYHKLNLSSKKTKVLIGYFESEKYFHDVRNQIKKEYVVNKKLSLENQKILNNIKNSNSICIHIRKGDYVKNPIYNVCNEKYYYDAIEIIKEKINSPKFFVFSDDINWVKDNLNLPAGTIYENEKNNFYETIKLMCNCKNFILSNSTISWWAQYLYSYENKIILAPDIWRNDMVCKDIYMDNWTIIETEKYKKN